MSLLSLVILMLLSVFLAYWCRELQQVWNKDAFLRSGGTANISKRRGENFNELYAACHAAEDKLKELTLKHGKAAKGTLKGKGQQENVAPTDKRRDALRCVDDSFSRACQPWLVLAVALRFRYGFGSANGMTDGTISAWYARHMCRARRNCRAELSVAWLCNHTALSNTCCHASMAVTVRVKPWQSVNLSACLLGHSSPQQGGRGCCTHIYVVWCGTLIFCICSWHAIALLVLIYEVLNSFAAGGKQE